jgi:hypothetical protein
VSQAQNAPAAKEPGINVNYMDKNVKPSIFPVCKRNLVRQHRIPADRTVGEVLMNCVKEQMLMRLLF